MCKTEKPATKEFFHGDKGKKDGFSTRCKECTNRERKRWNERNPERHIEYHKEYREKNREIISKRNAEQYQRRREQRLNAQKKWSSKNREKINSAARARYNGPIGKHKIHFSVASRIRRSLKGKTNGVFTNLPYTCEELAKHLEGQFEDGMNWLNYGEWHIDHIVPIASFDFNSTKDQQFQDCWALSNLRPLWAQENLSKGAKILDDKEEML